MTCNNCNSCNPCSSCKPACFKCDFDISAAPFDPNLWYVTWCGETHEVRIPIIGETDTTLSLDYANANLNYKAEKHTDIISGKELGSIINVEDLRNTDIDYDFNANCAEFIYHKYGDCGKGCKSLQDAWTAFSIADEGALQSQIRYVRGANVYGCPEYLNIPSNTSQYWFAGWRQDLQQFGYYQAQTVNQLPKDSKGNYIVMSVDPTTKQPILGTIPLDCIISNIIGNLGIEVFGSWNGQGTPGFTYTFDNMTGWFSIIWNDWIVENQVRYGYGDITGRIMWETSFDITTGNMNYVITGVYYDTITWTRDTGQAASAPSITLYSINPGTGVENQIFSRQLITTFSQKIDQTLNYNQNFSVAPGQTIGPIEFIRIWVDWIADDNGKIGVNFRNKLSSWNNC